ncbi:MAG: thioredoxin TrxC [Shewanella sp.]
MLISCPNCAGLNRVADTAMSQQPKCGHCQAPLLSGQVVTLTAQNFTRHANQSQLPLVIDFWADWCGPCKSFAPTFSTIAQTMAGRFRFGKLDTQTQVEIASQFGIRSIPTLMIIKEGQIVAQQAGAMSGQDFQHWLNAHA